MKSPWLYSMLFATILTVPGAAQLSVYIGSAPPRPRHERRGPVPGPGYAWIDGYWAPRGNRYSWVAGRWERPPYQGAHWTHAHYDHHKQGWQLHEGHWDRDEHGRDNDRDHGHDRDH